MKIAFISYEYPPDTGGGGIATYVRQAARMLASRGHHVEVFAASPLRCGTTTEEGIVLHRTDETHRRDFAGRIAPIFAARHEEIGFDVVEGPDYSADAREAAQLVPQIPLVVKLHTPHYIIRQIHAPFERGLLERARAHASALRRGTPLFWHPNDDVERDHCRRADEVAAPSRAIGSKLTRDWKLDPAKVSLVPLPYTPSEEMLRIPVETRTGVVTFLGRLEMRKGVLDLARAIPLILRRQPDARFRFVGQPVESPVPGMDMREYLEPMLERHSRSVEFTGPVPPDRIPSILAETDLCVFPSIWESFGLVCAEAMAAGRGVIASSAGGMAEILNHGEVGRTVPPHEPQRLATAVIELLADPEERMRLGQAARARVLAEYNADRIATLQEASYVRAIERRRDLGPRAIGVAPANVRELAAEPITAGNT
jgi:glycosyltransferase involved in cell wall biosynthesis